MQQIGFSGLKVHCIIGLHDIERTQKQPLIIDLTVDNEEFIDYTELATLSQHLAEVGHYLLLETLAQEIVKAVYQNWPSCQNVTVILKKPQAIPESDFAFVRLSL